MKKSISIVLLATILLQSCVAYRKNPTSLNYAANRGRVKVKFPWWHIFVKKTISVEEIEKAWDEELESVGDDIQLANIDLQNSLQKQAQTLQMMSNVSKMLHDTAMAVIRKIG